MNDQYYCVSHELYDFLYHSNVTIQGTLIDKVYKNDIVDTTTKTEHYDSLPVSMRSNQKNTE